MDEYLSKARSLWESDERKWVVSFRSPLQVWADNPTFLLLEVVTYVWAFLVYKHGKLLSMTHTKSRSLAIVCITCNIM